MIHGKGAGKQRLGMLCALCMHRLDADRFQRPGVVSLTPLLVKDSTMLLAPLQTGRHALLLIRTGGVLPNAALLAAARQQAAPTIHSQRTQLLLQVCRSTRAAFLLLWWHKAQAPCEEVELYDCGFVCAHQGKQDLVAQLLHCSVHQAAAQQGGAGVQPEEAQHVA